MSKPNATCAVLSTLVLCCLPVVAATISSDELRVRLGGSAQEVAPNHYQIAPGSTALLGIKSSPGDLIWCFAVGEDMWGEPDYSNILTLFFGRTEDGIFMAFFDVPESLAGRNFHVQAVAENSSGDLKMSEMLTVTVPGMLILVPATPNASLADPVMVGN